MIVRNVLSLFGVALSISATASATPSLSVISRTENALIDQMRCKARPDVAQAINAMLKSGLIRYVDNESGIYLFAPKVPLKFLGLPIKHISGFDRETAFRGVPHSRMVGTAPPVFIQLDIAAPASELKKRALAVGFTEAVPSEGKLGFEVMDMGSYLAGKNRSVISSIECAD